MKRFFAAVAALVCVLGLSVTSFAYYTKPVSDIPFLVKAGDRYKFDFVIPASQLSAASQESWKEMCSVLMNGSNNRFVVVTVSPTGTYSYGSVCFTLIDSDFKLVVNGSKMPSIAPSSGFTWKSFIVYVKDSSHTNISVSPSSVTSSSGFSIGSGASAPSQPWYVLRGASYLEPLHENTWVLDVPLLEFEDDLGTFTPEQPEEPDTPSSSSEPDESIPDTPKPPPYTPTPPTIPGSSQYVPYDTSIWNTFLDRIKTNIGSATNIGFLIFGVSVVWAILTRLVKKFTKAD